MRLSIRYQIVGLVAGILITAMLTYLTLATRLFTADKVAWLYDYNALLAGTLSDEVGTHLRTLADKLRYFGAEQGAASATEPDTAPQERTRRLFDANEDLLALELWRRTSPAAFERRYEYVDQDRLEALGIAPESLSESTRHHPLSLDVVAAEGVIVENASLPPDLALLRIATSVGGGEWAVVGFFRPDRLLRLFARSELHRTWLVDARGRVVLHPDAGKVLERSDESQVPIVRTALEGNLSRGAADFTSQGEAMLGAFARVPISRLAVMVEVPRKEAFRATTELNRRSALFAIGVIAVALLASIYFSRRMTRPIRKLEESMEKVSRGELGAEAEVSTRNEIGLLAEAFNRMSRELSRREALLIERNAQLVQSEKLSALGELSAGLAHEVKNPMVGIVGFSQLGGMATSLEEAKEYFTLIEADAYRANDILQHLLEFARPSKVEFSDLDPNEVIGGAVRLVAHQLQIERVKLETEYAPVLPNIRGNNNQLRQVLVNLMMNAAHAMQHTEERRLVVRSIAGAGNEVLIEVRDTGHGMSPEVQARLFQPFFTTKEGGKGTGLGLSVSRSIIQEHKGEIRVESTPGRGSTFHIRLPAAPAEESSAAAG